MFSETSTNVNKQDASSKWSGYNYQGKVALYVALYLINNPREINKNDDENWDRFAVEIEGLEDFSILKNNQYISIHQVKAYESSNTISNFKGALWGLLGKSIDFQNIQKSCLHTLKRVKELEDRNFDNKNKIKLLDPKEKSLESRYKESYISETEKLECAFDKLSFYNQHSSYRLDVELEEINLLVKEEIKTYYAKNNFSTDKMHSDYVNGIFNKLLYELDVYIYKRHKKELTQNDYIYFNKIIEYLNNGVDLATHEYFLLELRRCIGEWNLEHCDGCTEDEDFTDEQCKSCNIRMFRSEDVWIDNEKFIDFIRTINLHLLIDRNNLKVKDIVGISSYKKGYNRLTYMIEENQEYKGIYDSKVKYDNKLSKYMSTSIMHLKHGKYKLKEAKKISQDIMKSIESDAKLLVDLSGITTLISEDVKVESIKSFENKIGKDNLTDSDVTITDLKKEYELESANFNDLCIVEYRDLLEE